MCEIKEEMCFQRVTRKKEKEKEKYIYNKKKKKSLFIIVFMSCVGRIWHLTLLPYNFFACPLCNNARII